MNSDYDHCVPTWNIDEMSGRMFGCNFECLWAFSVLGVSEICGQYFQNSNCGNWRLLKSKLWKIIFTIEPLCVGELWMKKKKIVKKVAKMVKLFWMHAQEIWNSRFFWSNKLFDIHIKYYCEFATFSIFLNELVFVYKCRQ